MTETETRASKDWSDWGSNRRSYVLAWGIPTALLIIGIFLPASIRTIVWAGSLVWKGSACIANAARCGRTHCYVTGPFFLVMAALTVVHGTDMISLGGLGWWWIGVGIAVGNVTLWIIPERLFGRFLTYGHSR